MRTSRQLDLVDAKAPEDCVDRACDARVDTRLAQHTAKRLPDSHPLSFVHVQYAAGQEIALSSKFIPGRTEAEIYHVPQSSLVE